MNPYACRIELRPRSPLEVVDLAVRLVQDQAGPLARLGAWVLLPAWALAVVAGWAAGDGWVGAALLVAVAPALQVPFTSLCGRALFHDDLRVRDELRELPRWVLIGAVVTVSRTVALLPGLLSVGLLWPVIHAFVQFLPETLVLERQGVSEGVRRAGSLASDQMGKALLGSVIGLALAVWVVLAVEGALQGLVGFVLQLGAPFGQLSEGQATPWVLLGLVLAQPAVAIFRLLLYVDVRTVLEGWDLQVALRAAAEEAR